MLDRWDRNVIFEILTLSKYCVTPIRITVSIDFKVHAIFTRNFRIRSEMSICQSSSPVVQKYVQVFLDLRLLLGELGVANHRGPGFVPRYRCTMM